MIKAKICKKAIVDHIIEHTEKVELILKSKLKKPDNQIILKTFLRSIMTPYCWKFSARCNGETNSLIWFHFPIDIGVFIEAEVRTFARGGYMEVKIVE